ncbi:hypothetical protein Q361_103153 [Flavobacterium croceum DSM 17960]|uniref:DUF456 domain-containing protein n=1 Tax=Flavobacterium croceum DSM 17960 TaxID=1121886 RepID=A0A2S4NAC6_9FLAO|nr:DUF456 domain-containing protein [Flavobacterium croceum]POS02638.1 hypothetical protein Q361_103153 [Flavobacterium croceum DSM 17960]
MDTILLTLGFILCIVGIVGSFLPVLPGPVASWVGLLLLYLTDKVQNNYWVLGATLIVTITISILDYVIPAQGTKKFGGSKYGIWGTNIGLVVGLFIPPFGFILGPFVGAFVGELLYNSNDKKGALKAAIGSFIGFIVSTFMKVIVCLSFTLWFVYVAWKTFL